MISCDFAASYRGILTERLPVDRHRFASTLLSPNVVLNVSPYFVRQSSVQKELAAAQGKTAIQDSSEAVAAGIAEASKPPECKRDREGGRDQIASTDSNVSGLSVSVRSGRHMLQKSEVGGGKGAFALVVTGCLAAALSSGCGGTMPPIAFRPSATAGTEPSSWMARNAQAKSLLYVSDSSSFMFTPLRLLLLGTLRGFYLATGECVDARGDGFIVNSGTAKIFKYAHGGTKRLATLQSPTRDPVGCAVNTTTGDLAVTSEGFG